MKISKTSLMGLLLIDADRFEDDRGFFMETWQKERYYKLGLKEMFVQDNLSHSMYGVLRGLHYQYPHGQGKLVYVIEGEVYDVAVDIRKGSPNFGKWEGHYLSADNKRQLYIPKGFAHGFCVTSESALLLYKCTDSYQKESEKGIYWDDPDLDITWPVLKPTLSEKDKKLPYLLNLNETNLPAYSEVYKDIY